MLITIYPPRAPSASALFVYTYKKANKKYRSERLRKADRLFGPLGNVRASSGKRNYAVIRATILLVVLALAIYTAFFRLGAGGWHADEPIYRDSGLEYIRDNNFRSNLEHPFLAKYILGVTQVMLGSSEPEVIRIPAAVAFLLTGLTLFFFARRVAGFWVGVLALALWTISPLALMFGRVATLEVFVGFFSTLALYFGWRWAESRKWTYAGWTGVAAGLAVTSKPVGILILPAILFAGLLKIGISRRLVIQSQLLLLVTTAVALATYIPMGSQAPSAIQYMFEFQSAHSARGHPVSLGGTIYQFPPWWAHLWWQWEVYGTLATLSLGIAIVVALLRRHHLDLYLLTAVLIPFLFLSFYVDFKLSSYFYVWQPPLILLLALAAGKLPRWRTTTGIALAALLLVPFVYLGAQAVMAPNYIQPGKYTRVAEYLESINHARGPILVWGQRSVFGAELPEAQTLTSPGEKPRGESIETILVEESFSSRHANPRIEKYLENHSDEFNLTHTVKDIDIYTRE